MDRFEKALNRLSGRDYELSIVGDLDDLLFTLGKVVQILRSIAEEGDKIEVAELRSRLHALVINLEEDIPLILEDLTPPLSQLLDKSFKRREKS